MTMHPAPRMTQKSPLLCVCCTSSGSFSSPGCIPCPLNALMSRSCNTSNDMSVIYMHHIVVLYLTVFSHD